LAALRFRIPLSRHFAIVQSFPLTRAGTADGSAPTSSCRPLWAVPAADTPDGEAAARRARIAFAARLAFLLVAFSEGAHIAFTLFH
jgi:hypothetical protein